MAVHCCCTAAMSARGRDSGNHQGSLTPFTQRPYESKSAEEDCACASIDREPVPIIAVRIKQAIRQIMRFLRLILLLQFYNCRTTSALILRCRYKTRDVR